MCSKITDYFVMQSQSPILQRKIFEKIIRDTKVFKDRKVYLSFVPMYPGGMWSFIVASNKKIEIDLDEIRKRYEERKISTRYYTPEMHTAAFTLPKWINEIVELNI
jgi:spermidine synthase